HIHGLSELGADIRVRGGVIEASSSGLRGECVSLPFPSVGATENLMMAACLARGKTTIMNSAMEPEICDLANFLRSMGANIWGDGTGIIQIKGVRRLHPASHRPIPDRIEAGTIMIASAISGGDVLLHNVIPAHLRPVSKKLLEAGAMVLEGHRCIRVMGPPRLCPVSVCARPHPGYPTDLQAQMMALACMAQGESCIEETVFENRFLHIAELQKMGAQIEIDGCTARICGGSLLHGAQVSATDLRGGAALALAGLCAHGPTRIENIYNIDRGYEGLDLKLCSLGADIRRIRSSKNCISDGNGI
ncbi:MAG: UDP-N-acetylglucosamine 1-carboxyvinyltransferase, partial [Christensenellales bacterium]